MNFIFRKHLRCAYLSTFQTNKFGYIGTTFPVLDGRNSSILPWPRTRLNTYVSSSCTHNIGYVFVRNIRSPQINSQLFHQYYYSSQHAIVLEKRVLQTHADAPEKVSSKYKKYSCLSFFSDIVEDVSKVLEIIYVSTVHDCRSYCFMQILK